MTVTYSIVIGEGQDSAFVQELSSVHMGFWGGSGELTHEQVFTGAELPADLTFTVTLPADRYSHIVTANCQTGAPAEHNHFGGWSSHVPRPHLTLSGLCAYRHMLAR